MAPALAPRRASTSESATSANATSASESDKDLQGTPAGGRSSRSSRDAASSFAGWRAASSSRSIETSSRWHALVANDLGFAVPSIAIVVQAARRSTSGSWFTVEAAVADLMPFPNLADVEVGGGNPPSGARRHRRAARRHRRLRDVGGAQARDHRRRQGRAQGRWGGELPERSAVLLTGRSDDRRRHLPADHRRLLGARARATSPSRASGRPRPGREMD